MDTAPDHPSAPPMTVSYLLSWASAVVGIAVLLIWYRHLSDVAEGAPAFLLDPAINEGTGVLGGGLMFFPIRALVYRWPLARGQLLARIPAYLATLVVLSFLHTTWNWGTRLVLHPLAGLGSYDYGRMPIRYFMEFPADIVIFVIAAGGIHVARRLSIARRRELEAARIESTLAHAQLDNLRLRLQPHFLFNTLNAVSSVMYDDPDTADRILDRLSTLLRASLRHGPTDLVPLAAEVDTVRSYLDIAMLRFGDRLKLELDIAHGADEARVPAFLLQPLVENALRHGRLELEGRGRIRLTIAVQDSELTVEIWNDGPLATDSSGSGIGLNTTRERLRLLYGDSGSVDARPFDDGYRVRLRLPLHPPEAP